jgi:hypothetical protein
MKMWRGEPDHGHWKGVGGKLSFTPRQKSNVSLGLAAVGVSLALASAASDRASCESGGRLVCTTVRFVAASVGTSVQQTEVAVWAALALSLLVLGVLQRRG